jgi:DNA repair protein RadA/Sms
MKERIPLVESDGRVEELCDVVVPEKFFKKMLLGIDVLDAAFGGRETPGIVPGTSFLFTGVPGAGKSTLCVQLAQLLRKNAGKTVLYNAGEESIEMVKMRADRLGLRGDFGVGQIGDIDALIEVCRHTGIDVLFQDSLQAIDDGPVLRGGEALKDIVRKLHRLSKSDGVTVFAICHTVKSGGFAGPQTIKHDLDAHVNLGIDRDTGARYLELLKNRFGPAMTRHPFSVTSDGVVFRQVMESTDEEETGSRELAELLADIRKER